MEKLLLLAVVPLDDDAGQSRLMTVPTSSRSAFQITRALMSSNLDSLPVILPTILVGRFGTQRRASPRKLESLPSSLLSQPP